MNNVDDEGLCAMAREVRSIDRLVVIGQSVARARRLEPILRRLQELAAERGADPRLHAVAVRLAKFHQDQQDAVERSVAAWRDPDAPEGDRWCA
jgi:hypothetical protein